MPINYVHAHLVANQAKVADLLAQGIAPSTAKPVVVNTVKSTTNISSAIEAKAASVVKDVVNTTKAVKDVMTVEATNTSSVVNAVGVSNGINDACVKCLC